MLGLVIILYSLCNYIYAQVIQSQVINNLNDNQIFILMGIVSAAVLIFVIYMAAIFALSQMYVKNTF
jgi:hypothetical protein